VLPGAKRAGRLASTFVIYLGELTSASLTVPDDSLPRGAEGRDGEMDAWNCEE
jgi:hypothetical protein